MAYLDDESGTATGDAVELYKFTAPTTAYRYTSARTAQTYLAEVYDPAPGLSRTSVGAGSTEERAVLSVTIDGASAVVADFGSGAPPASLRLQVFRRQAVSGEVRTIWDGAVIAIARNGSVATLRSSSQVGLRMSTRIPSLTVTNQCQHVLYDERCRVDRATYAQAATVVSISGGTITVSTVGSHGDEWFGNGGEIERTADGERRFIYSQIGAVLTLEEPFTALAVSDAVTLWPGCDHRFRTYTTGGSTIAEGHCLTKFANTDNFGGHSNVPSGNPFVVGVKGVA